MVVLGVKWDKDKCSNLDPSLPYKRGLRVCLVSVFQELFFVLENKKYKKTCLGSGCAISSHCSLFFQRTIKCCFPCFCNCSNDKKYGSSLYVFNLVFSMFSVIFPSPVRSVQSPSTHLLFPLFPNMLKFFLLLNLDDFGRLEKLVGKKVRLEIFLNNFYELFFLVGLFCYIFRT